MNSFAHFKITRAKIFGALVVAILMLLPIIALQARTTWDQCPQIVGVTKCYSPEKYCRTVDSFGNEDVCKLSEEVPDPGAVWTLDCYTCSWSCDSGAGYQSCGSSCYQPANQICCGGVIRPKDGTSACCGTGVYDPATQFCCGGTAYDQTAQSPYHNTPNCTAYESFCSSTCTACAAGFNLIAGACVGEMAQYWSQVSGTSDIYNNLFGNVGIGTDTPNFKLDAPSNVQARIGAAEIGYWPSGGVTAYAYFGHELLNHDSSVNYALIQSGQGATYLNSAPGQEMYFRQGNVSQMALVDGNLGIGITAPQARLNIFDSTSGPIISLQGLDNNYRGVRIADLGNSEKWFAGSNDNNQYVIRRAGSSNDVLVDTSGHVGIGVFNPSAKLEVAGQIKITGGEPGAGKVLTSDNTGLASWQTPPAGTVYTAGAGINVTGNVITNTAPNVNQTLSINGNNLSISDGNTVILPQNIYTAGTGIDISGNVVSNTAPDQTVGLTGVGSVSVSGTYPNFTITGVDTNTTYTAGTDISIVGTTINNTAPNATHTGDATGAGALTVVALRNKSISPAAPTENQVLKWQNGQWTPAVDELGSVNLNYNCGAGNVLQAFDSAGNYVCVANGGQTTADGYIGNATGNGHGGSHLAGNNVGLNDKWLSNDGANEGIQISDAGSVLTSGEVRAKWLHATDAGNNTIAGNLGIGTNNPTSKLEVSNGTVGLQIKPGSYWSGVAWINDDNYVALDIAGTKNLNIVDNLLVSGGTIRSTRANFVGQHLELNGGDSTGIKLSAVSVLNAEKPLIIENLSSETTPGANNKIEFKVGTNAAPSTKMIINKDGNVGIGTINPSAKLEVAGQIKITGGEPGAGKVLTSDDSTGLASWQTPSAGTIYTAGTDISIVGTTINNTAPDQTVGLTGVGSVSVSGTYPNFTITGVDTNTTYTAGDGISIDADNHIINTAKNAVHGGDVSYNISNNNLTVDGLRGVFIAPIAANPAIGQILKYNGSAWSVADDDVGATLPTGNNGDTLRYNGSAWVADGLIYNNGSQVGINSAPLGGYVLSIQSNTTQGMVVKNSQTGVIGYLAEGDRGVEGSTIETIGVEGYSSGTGIGIYGNSAAGYSGKFDNGKGVYIENNDSGTALVVKNNSTNSSAKTARFAGSAQSESVVSVGVGAILNIARLGYREASDIQLVGVYGESHNYIGVKGVSDNVAGVLGSTKSGWGVYGSALAANGKAVYGSATTDAWAGYFTGGKGVFANQLCLGTETDCKTSWPTGDNLGNHIATQNIVYSTDGWITRNTADGADNGYLGLVAGGAQGPSRGGGITVYGNEFINAAGYKGRVTIEAGNVYTSGNDGAIVFRTGSGIERLVVGYNGNVGIGTSIPDSKLEVSNGTVGLQIKPGSYWNGSAWINNNDYVALDIDGTKNLNIVDNLLVSGGSVGIGTTAPAEKLEVADGSLKISSSLTGNELLYSKIGASGAVFSLDDKDTMVTIGEGSCVDSGNICYGIKSEWNPTGGATNEGQVWMGHFTGGKGVFMDNLCLSGDTNCKNIWDTGTVGKIPKFLAPADVNGLSNDIGDSIISDNGAGQVDIGGNLTITGNLNISGNLITTAKTCSFSGTNTGFCDCGTSKLLYGGVNCAGTTNLRGSYPSSTSSDTLWTGRCSGAGTHSIYLRCY